MKTHVNDFNNFVNENADFLFETSAREVAPGKRIFKALLQGVPSAAAYRGKFVETMQKTKEALKAQKEKMDAAKKDGKMSDEEIAKENKKVRVAIEREIQALKKFKKQVVDKIGEESEQLRKDNKLKFVPDETVDKEYEVINKIVDEWSKDIEEEQEDPADKDSSNEEKIKKAEEKLKKLEDELKAAEAENEEADKKSAERNARKEEITKLKMEYSKIKDEDDKLGAEFGRLDAGEKQGNKGKELLKKHDENVAKMEDIKKKGSELEDKMKDDEKSNKDEEDRKQAIYNMQDKIENQKEKIDALRSGKDPNESTHVSGTYVKTFEGFIGNEESLDEAYSSRDIDAAVEDGMDAFWSAVAGKFPQVKTGDFAPADAANLEKALKVAVTAWLKQNS